MKPNFIYIAIFFIVAVAMTAIVFVLSNQWGWLEFCVAGTAIICSVSGLGIFACDLARTRSGKRKLATIGNVLILLSSSGWLLFLWADDSFLHRHVLLYKINNVIGAFAFATSHTCLLSIARLRKKFAWVLTLAMLISFGLAACISYYNFLGTVNGFEPQHNRDVLRWIYALVVAVTMMTALVPLIHVLSKIEKHGNPVHHGMTEENKPLMDADGR